ncbi:MAG: hypothetical protein P4L53_09100 [Candidatus Obscuribacterales bacterium]|nr:hypothetical protein [Candidatus Obscuribacterales bacterium]
MKFVPLLASMLAASLGYGLFSYFMQSAPSQCFFASLFGAALGYLTWTWNNNFRSWVSPSLRNSVLVSAVCLSVFWFCLAVCTMLHLHQAISWQFFFQPSLLFFGIGAFSGGANHLASQVIKKWQLKVSTAD